MHYVAIITGVLLVCLAYGGHSKTFAQAFQAVTAGEPARAADLFTDALSNTLRDADNSPRRTAGESAAAPPTSSGSSR